MNQILLAILCASLAGCSSLQLQPKEASEIIISIADQQLHLRQGTNVVKTYTISSSRNGVGEAPNQDTTPRGLLAVSEKIGEDQPVGMVFVGRAPTGEIVQPNTPGRWPVITRILRLRGLEERNKNTEERLIYIHGSPVESALGSPASGGCIRLNSRDVLELFDLVDVNAPVRIIEEPYLQFVGPAPLTG